MSTVRAGTLALVSSAGQTKLKGPGELLLPNWPFRPAVKVLVVNTEPVALHVRVDHLSTLDHEDLDWVELEVVVQVEGARVLDLAEPDVDLDSRLVLETRSVIEACVRAAVGLNRAQDLRRQSLTGVLDNRWMPTSFLHGALTRVGFTVRKIAWTGDSEEPPRAAPPPGSSSRDDSTPRLASLSARWPHSERSAAHALQLVYVPALISVGTFWLFFSCFWLPELGGLPGARFVLEQLAPLASKELTSGGQPLVPSQADHSGLVPAFLLVAGLLLPPLARSRHWLARLFLWPLTYLAAVGAVVSVIGAALRGQLGENFLGLVLLSVWVATAVVTTWRSLWVDLDTLPFRPSRSLLPLAAFALFSPAPIAVGRLVFAPELRDSALAVLHNHFSLRWAALLTPATALLYLCGLLLASVAWVVYELWPPRPVRSVRLPVTVLALTVVGLAALGPRASSVAEQRAEVIRTQSPAAEMGSTCGRWTYSPAGEPVQTVAVTGLTCRRITSFSGYRRVASREPVASLSPIKAETLQGQRIAGRVVAAQFGDVLVLAGTERSDDRATEVMALSMAGDQLWRYACPSKGQLNLRFVGAPGGDDTTLGRLTLPGEVASVTVGCGAASVRLDPRTGRQL